MTSVDTVDGRGEIAKAFSIDTSLARLLEVNSGTSNNRKTLRRSVPRPDLSRSYRLAVSIIARTREIFTHGARKTMIYRMVAYCQARNWLSTKRRTCFMRERIGYAER